MSISELQDPPGAVELREDAPLRSGATTTRFCAGGPRAIAGGFAVLTAAVTVALLTQIYSGDYEVVPHGSVSSSAAACSRAGAASLRTGGRAIDAAVTAALCLAVLEPHRTSLDASSRTQPPTAVEWGGPELIESAESGSVIARPRPPRLLVALAALHAQMGMLPWAAVVKPAIDLAREGYIVSESMSAVATARGMVGFTAAAMRTEPSLANYLETLLHNTSSNLCESWACDNLRRRKVASVSAGAWRIWAAGAGASSAAALSSALPLDLPHLTPAAAFERVVKSLQQQVQLATITKQKLPTGVASGLAIVDPQDTYLALVTGLSTPFGSGPAEGAWTRDEPSAPLDLAPAIITDQHVCVPRTPFHNVSLLMRCHVFCVALIIATSSCTNGYGVSYEGDGPMLAVTASAPGVGAAALAHVAVTLLHRAGVPARVVPPPGACMPPYAADQDACRDAIVADLTHDRLHVALLTVPAASASRLRPLRDANIDELGDVTPPSRRICLAPPPAHSLLDLSDPNVAHHYYIKSSELATQNTFTNDSLLGSIPPATLKPKWCTPSVRCAAVLTSDMAEARILFDIIQNQNLYALVYLFGSGLSEMTTKIGKRFILCDFAPDSTDILRAKHLGPPPCPEDTHNCPFESRRLMKIVNTRALALLPGAVQALFRLSISTNEMRELRHLTRILEPNTAALSFLSAHHTKTVAREVRVVVLLPNPTTREAYDAASLAAAAALAEADLEADWSSVARFKVITHDDHCDATHSFQYISDARLSSDYLELSAVAGPACGAAFADVARQSTSHGLLAIAYTPQAPPAAPAAALTLLAAGDSRMYASALGSLFTELGWRRLAALTEPATRTSLASARLQADIVAHVELSDDRVEYDPEIFIQWAERVVYADGRVVYVCVEDARALRAALCAGHLAGLQPSAGVAWLLPAALPSAAYNVTPQDGCSQDQLDEMLEGHISIAPEWLLPWLDNYNDGKTPEVNKSSPSESGTIARWTKRWRTQCGFLHGACSAPGPHAALLYDVLRLWAETLAELFSPNSTKFYDLHNRELVRSLVKNATRDDYAGELTGSFQWVAVNNEDDNGTAYARSSPLVVLQWERGVRRRVARWSSGRLEPTHPALRWSTLDGRVPRDGSDYCALQMVADAFRSDCRTAFVVLGVLLLTGVVVALGAAAYYCRIRAEREYKSRLEALGLHSLVPKLVGLDRWEILRERVVINRKLGMGAFGTVYGGHALLAEDRGWTAVAVKTLKAGASTEEKLDFLSEAEAMKRFDHGNIVRLLAVITKTEPVCTVMEFMLYGDLKNYLLARRHLACGGEDADEQVSARRLTAAALDVARALGYLAQLRYVHRDVAARNCLVSARRVIKLADFGMTRLVFENDYYRFSRKGMLPVRWMAPESLTLGVFSPASDVWSFGVLLYEIVTFGSLPFQGLGNAEVLTQVKNGYTLELPPGLKPQLEALIRSCWLRDSKVRPTASELAAQLAEAPRLLTPCLDVPLDALPLDSEPPWRAPRERAEARWLSWAAPTSAATDTTYLSAEGPRDTDAFLP